MARFALITFAAVPAASGLKLMARVLGYSGETATAATFSAVSYAVTDLTTGTVIGSGPLSPGVVIFDSLQTQDRAWTKDEDGYNFAWVVPGALLQNGGDRYQIDVRFTPVSGESFVVTWAGPLLAVYA